MLKLKSIKEILYSEYLSQTKGISEKFYGLREAEISSENFSFYTSVSSVFSSKIEGEDIDLDSYIKHKNFGVEFQPDYTKKIDDLYEAYNFAENSRLTEKNVLQAHKILTKNILQTPFQGTYRKSNMYVLTDNGQIEYVAASPFEVENEIKNFFSDIAMFLEEKLSVEEIFFYASLIHLVFVKIHPMNDGNGRLGRLLEKWFIAEKLGEKTWFLQSEKMYYQNHQLYYRNIRKLGLEYESLDYTQSLAFLKMLPKALEL